MTITKGNKTVSIPNWAILAGLLVADNMVTNLCKVKQTKIMSGPFTFNK